MKVSELKPDSRVWVYMANRKLSKNEVQFVERSGEKFIEQWATHGKKLAAGITVMHDAFVVIIADEAQVKASGCSIDSSVHWVKAVGNELQVNFFDRMRLAIRNQDGTIEILPVAQVEQGFEKGSFDESTVVFNTLVSTKSELDNDFEIPLKESWVYARVAD